jgi:histidine triad (HIT) family protein
VAGEVPSEEVAATERTYAFRDIKPALPVHVLVVPREHVVSADTLTPEHADLLAEMMVTAQQVARSEGLSERGYRLVFNVGEDAQNSVAHLHMHLVGGRPMAWPPG